MCAGTLRGDAAGGAGAVLPALPAAPRPPVADRAADPAASAAAGPRSCRLGPRGAAGAATGHGGPSAAGGAGAGAAAAAAIARGGRGTMKDGSGRGDDPRAELPQPSAGVHGRRQPSPCRCPPGCAIHLLPDLALRCPGGRAAPDPPAVLSAPPAGGPALVPLFPSFVTRPLPLCPSPQLLCPERLGWPVPCGQTRVCRCRSGLRNAR